MRSIFTLSAFLFFVASSIKAQTFSFSPDPLVVNGTTVTDVTVTVSGVTGANPTLLVVGPLSIPNNCIELESTGTGGPAICPNVQTRGTCAFGVCEFNVLIGSIGGAGRDITIVNGLANTNIGLQLYTDGAFKASGNMSATLPVKLLYFKARKSQRAVMLDWATATEENNEGFVIERSFDGQNFDEIAKVSGNGNSLEEIAYSFEDKGVLNQATSNTAYYRLRQFDFDGTSTFLDLVSVNLKANGGLQINNIRTEDSRVNLSFQSEVNTEINARVFDIQGKLLGEAVVMAEEGFNGVEIPVVNMQRGIYFITLNDKDNVVSQKVMW